MSSIKLKKNQLNKYEKFVNQEQWPQQAYCTVDKPKEVKGPHLHKKRWRLFTCIKKNIKIVIKQDNKCIEHFFVENYDFSTIQVLAGIPAAIINIKNTDAYILNMPLWAWQPDDIDECGGGI